MEYGYVPPDYLPFQNALSGQTDLTDEIFSQAADILQHTDRSEVYKWLDKIDFTQTIYIQPTIFQKPPHDEFYYIDGATRIRRKRIADDDDVFVPNCSMLNVLKEVDDLPGYGKLNSVLDVAARKDDNPHARMAVQFYETATSQARQIKAPLERFLQCLLIAESCPLADDPVGFDTTTPPPLSSNLPLYVIRELSKIITSGSSNRSPWMFTATDVMWAMSPRMTSAIPPLMADLCNLAIQRQICRIPDDLCEAAVTMYLNAANSPSYAWYILKTKSVFTSNTLHNVYRKPVEGIVPEMVWLNPRTDYRFMISGARKLTANDVNQSLDNEDDAIELGKKYHCEDVVRTLRRQSSSIKEHTHDSVKWIRDAMACTSSIFITRAPTETVLKEYTQAPKIEKPLLDSDFLPPIGEVRYLRKEIDSPASFLQDTWETAANKISNDHSTWDPLNQAIMRSQYVTSRGGSGAALRDILAAADISLPTFPGVRVKPSTKILQAAQTSGVPFDKLSRAVTAPLSMGLRNQVQRRPRTIMPMNVVQQQVSAVHTLVADYINKHMNLSTTSGSAVIEKVIPLGMYASSPPTQTINIDIKACDASITYQYFLSVITGAIHRGTGTNVVKRPFMGVPPTRVSTGYNSSMPISGTQHMAQLLAKLYKRGFDYKVNDHFSPGNVFTLQTTTFPSGSTATSTEHTANNSTMMNAFLTYWLPRNCSDKNVLKFAGALSIKSNYICQGDDGIMVLDGNLLSMISGKTVGLFCDKLREYGRSFGWNYDIEFNGTTEYLKLYFLFGCRIPNISRHPIVGKERATSERAEVWPATIDVMMGVYTNGVHDMLHTRQWIRFNWVLACMYSRQQTKNKLRTVTVQYPMWAFVYLGLPPIRVFGCTPYSFSVCMPTGDMGMYAVLTILRQHIHDECVRRGYVTETSGPFGNVDHVRLFNETGVYQGYYLAQLPRNPIRTDMSSKPEDVRRFQNALRASLPPDPVSPARVEEGKRRWRNLTQEYLSRPPSLDQVAAKWYKGAQDADTATTDEVNAMDAMLMRATSHKYTSFSKLLEAYLRVDWDYDDETPEPVVDLRAPLCAGVDPTNSDHFLKLYGLGPMMESTKRYFSQTLFMHRTVSGLDVDEIDKALLRLRTLGASREAIVAQLMMVGLDENDASTLAGKIMVQDIGSVQLARVVNLAVPDSWMTLDFDHLLKYRIKFTTSTVRSLTTDIPSDLTWMKPIFRFLGASVSMTTVGLPATMKIKSVRHGVRSLSILFKRWMAAEGK
ncbi:lambda B [Reptilian orthoreovirus]|uniref:RNA-directed RNA polymerase n=2 Tax=Orthoreovirus TaxID=10882 RepID=A0A1D7PVI2_9REOV|nr:lambda B [Reptilian orthoreovirus]AOM63686.1 lambda B [chelonian orthoreovirus]